MKQKKWTALLAAVLTLSLLAGCTGTPAQPSAAPTPSKTPEPSGSQVAAGAYTPGTYTAEAQGRESAVKVTITVSADAITDVQADASGETTGIGDTAAASLAGQILESQSIGLDAVTGATLTSNAVLAAAEDCLTQAGGDITALKTPLAKENEGQVNEISTDVVVIGAGGSGISCAITSAEAGAGVVLLEKTAIPGGTTANGGGFFAADSRMSRDMGQEPLDTDYIFEQYMEEMDWLCQASMVKKFLETSKGSADWCVEHGMEIHKMEEAVQQSHGAGTNGYHKYNDFTQTSAAFGRMLEECGGVSVYYETPAYELVTDADGAVVGVLASAKDGSTLKVNAKSVVIATGGFVGNEEMVKAGLNGVSVNASGYNTNVGDGIDMAVALGAATRSMSAMVNHTFTLPGAANVTGEYDPMDKVHATGAIAYIPMDVWLNQDGVRFANEDIVYDRMLTGHAVTTQGDYGWFLYNQKLIDTLENEGAAAAGMYDKIMMGPWTEYTPMNEGWGGLNAIMNEMVDGMSVIKAASLEDLAAQAGMDKDTLLATMETYNADCQAGKDSLYGKRASHMQDMSEGPYYLVKVTVNNLCTVGGLRINDSMNVVRDDPENGYTAIPNLFAAGADASAIYADHYAHTIEGAAQGWAYASGRLAAQAAAKNAIGVDIDAVTGKPIAE